MTKKDETVFKNIKKKAILSGTFIRTGQAVANKIDVLLLNQGCIQGQQTVLLILKFSFVPKSKIHTLVILKYAGIHKCL